MFFLLFQWFAASFTDGAWIVKQIAMGNKGVVKVVLSYVVVVVVVIVFIGVFVVFSSLLMFLLDFNSVASSMSIMFASSSSSGMVPQSLSKVPMPWAGFSIGTFVIVVAIGAHHVQPHVEFLLGKLAQEPVLNYRTSFSSI